MPDQGVVTYMSRVEAFVTGIKIESSDQSPFGGANQGIKVTSELLKINNQQSKINNQQSTIKNQECTTAMWPLTLWNQAIKSLRRVRSSDQAHFLPIKKPNCSRKRFYRQHVRDYPLQTTKRKLCAYQCYAPYPPVWANEVHYRKFDQKRLPF